MNAKNVFFLLKIKNFEIFYNNKRRGEKKETKILIHLFFKNDKFYSCV